MKRVAAIAGIVAAVLLAGAAAASFLVSGDYLKARIAGQIATWTGRAVTITGTPSLSFYPYLAVTVDGLVIGNREDGPPADDALLSAEVLRATLRPLPLLVGRAEFEEFELIRPRVRFVRADDGSGNWRMATSAILAQAIRAAAVDDPADTATPITRTATSSGTLPPGNVRIGRLRFSDGIVLFDDLATERREEMTDVDLDINWPTAADSAGGSGSGVWRGQPVQFNGSVIRPLSLIAGGASPLRFALASTVARVAFSGTADTTVTPSLSGDATLTTPSLRDTIGWLGTDFGTSPILGAGAISGSATWNGSVLTFDNATIELDGNTATGSGSLALSGSRPKLEAALTLTRLDLTPYIEAARAEVVSHNPWLLAPAQLPFTQALDLSVVISAEQVLAGSLRLSGMKGHAALADGSAVLTLDEAQLFGGSLTGSLRTAVDDGILSATASLSATAVPAGVALQDIVGIAAIDGRSNLTLDLATSGKSWGEFIRAATGTGTVRVSDGILRGFDLPALAREMADPFAEVGPTSVETPFYELAAPLTFSDGNIVTEDLTMRGNGYRLTLAGRGSLVTGLIDASALLSTPETEAPLSIAGNWYEATVMRDLERPRPGASLAPSPAGE